MSSKSKDCDAAAPSTSSGRKSRFPELPPKYSSSRELRNKAEKMRRDRLNGLIEEMRALVPMICNKTKKSDTTRSTILRLTANYLRVSRLFSQDANTGDREISGIVSEGLPHLESMDGFFFILAEDGRLLFVSENIDKFIGYSQIEMMGFPIFNFTHPADQSKIRRSLQKKEDESSCRLPTFMETAEDISEVSASSRSSTPHPLVPYQPTTPERGPRQSFYIRLREKPLAKQDMPQYEHMHMVGHLRRQEDTKYDKARTGGHHTFIGVMRPVRDRPITELSLVESSQDQYITRHTPDGRIVYTDHRISTIAGYLPSEVRGKSAFNFFFAEDLPWTTMAMRHMFASSNGEGSTVYRLFTQTGELICLQTKGFLEFNKTTNKIESFLCINTVIRPEDSEKYLNEQKERFTPFISQLQINSSAAGQSLETTSSSSLLLGLEAPSSSMLPSPVSVISRPATTGSYSTSPPSSTSPGSKNIMKRSFAEASARQKEQFTVNERPESKVMKLEKNNKRKLEDDGGGERQGKKNNWQYTVRREPVHRTEDGIRVVDIEEQFCTPDPTERTCYKTQDGEIEFHDLMNEMNRSLQGSSHSYSAHQPQHPAQQMLSDQGLNQTTAQVISNAASGPRRVASVIKMLPNRQTAVQDSPLPAIGYGDPLVEGVIQPNINTIHSTINPLDSDGSLADFLSQPSFNQPTNNSITRESDLIKQELINSSCSEAERIAEKLKQMLAPLSEQQNRSNSQSQIKLPETPEPELSSLTLANHQHQIQGGQENSSLFEIINQDLVFSLDGAHSQEKQLSPFKDEVPATSS